MNAVAQTSLQPDNPWPGLAPFDENDRAFFHGRDAEIADMLRLVRREPLTVLFGRSGLGKSSLLKAGLFPALRSDDLLPVYVRLDHAENAPPLRDQVLRELQAACDEYQLEATRPEAEEALWSYFHRRDAEFWSALNRPVTPVIVFDQFEEIFTHGQEGQAARTRTASFLTELADLVENRPPPAVKLALERDPAAAARYNFRGATVKLVLSFREDFLAQMEGLKSAMPSVMVNRLRLLPMDGAQAYAVVTKSGGALIDDDVARRILRLAWKNEPAPPVEREEFPRIEIDPALLSVVCTELNHNRLQAEPPPAMITQALLSGADREILAGFYERSMAGLDRRVRAFVEDELITDRGFRDSHDWHDALALPGVTSDALDALTARRLLRADTRQGQRRVELTHDVLTRIVKDSRDRRRAREAGEAAEARERAAREQQRKNRRNGTFVFAGVLLMLLLAGVAGWQAMVAREAQDVAVVQQQRANTALLEATKQKLKADQLVTQAHGTRLLATADQLQDGRYDASLLINLEALRMASTPDTQAGMLRRFNSHPHLSAFLAGHKDAGRSVAFSPDGRQVASAGFDKTVILWDLESRKPLATLEGHRNAIYSVAFSPDGKRLASASRDKTVILWDLDSRKPLATLEGHKNNVYGVAFSPDGKRLASASEDGTVILWDLDSRKLLATLEGHKEAVTSVAFSPDGKRLASTSRDKTVILWDLDSRKPLATLEGHKREVSSVAFSPDGKRLASASQDKTVILWDLDSRKPLATLEGHSRQVSSVAFSPDGKRLASASQDKTVILWDLASREPLATLEGHTEAVTSVAFSPDGKHLASTSRDKTVILWDLGNRKLLATLEGHKNSATGVAFSPDGKPLASASLDGTVILWDPDNRTPLATLEGHKEAVTSVAFSPDGKRLASASFDDTVILWDLDSRKPLATLAGHKGAVTSVAFSPDGKLLAAAISNQTVILWDLDSRKPLATLEGHKEAVTGVAFSPDGKRLASASFDDTVILWDLDSRKPLATLAGNKRAVYGVAVSPDGKLIASAGRDKTVILWDLDSRKLLATLEGHEEPVTSIAFSPDGKRLASASEDKTVILWDLDSRKSLVTLEGHKETVTSVAFRPDGKQLASASDDKTLILWDLDPESLTTEACRTANRNLSCQEWRQHIGHDIANRKTCEALPGPTQACN